MSARKFPKLPPMLLILPHNNHTKGCCILHAAAFFMFSVSF